MQPFPGSQYPPDFNLRSLRSNLVFRWEYRSGSTLYFAWTHSRSDVQPLGDFNFSRDEQGLLATRPDNILLIKASWWWAHQGLRKNRAGSRGTGTSGNFSQSPEHFAAFSVQRLK